MQYNHTNIIKLQGVSTREETPFYLGKRVAYIYRVRARPRSPAPAAAARRIRGPLLRAAAPPALLGGGGGRGVPHPALLHPPLQAPKNTKGSRLRCIWGKIVAAHGNSGAVRAKFRHNLPASSMGAPVRVMLYPSHV